MNLSRWGAGDVGPLIVGKTSDSDNSFSFERFLEPRAVLEPKEKIL